MSLVACGWRHTICVSYTGQLYTYGWSKYGQLGHGDFEDHLTPHKLEALKNHCISLVLSFSFNPFYLFNLVNLVISLKIISIYRHCHFFFNLTVTSKSHPIISLKFYFHPFHCWACYINCNFISDIWWLEAYNGSHIQWNTIRLGLE
jgi:Regulator of chromosome condensation (RCC1) repeat